MVASPEVLAIIPAYGSSDESIHQYRKPLGAHPLIAYSIAAGVKAAAVTRTLVATQSEAVAVIARDYGADVPFLLPPEPADLQVNDQVVVRFVLSQLAEQQACKPELVIWLNPFAPIRPRECVNQAVQMLLASPLAAAVCGVTPAGLPARMVWKIDPQGHLVSISHQAPEANPAIGVVSESIYYQTRHINAIRVGASLADAPWAAQVSLPLVLDARYNVDIEAPFGWEWANWVVRHAQLDMVFPGRQPRPLPEHVALLVLDFDGVMTDNRVWVEENGHEQIAAYRGDSMGLSRLRQTGVDAIVLSTETNPVVAARCRKLNLPVMQGVSDKASALRAILAERQVDPAQVVYLGNDVNDLPCFPMVGCAVVTADAHHNARYQADLVLTQRGGYGAVRELCDILLRET